MKRDAGDGAVLAPLAIKSLSSSDEARWDRFVETCPQATFFHYSGWKPIIEDVFRHRTFYLYAERGGEILGVLPLARVRSWLFGDVLCSLPFCVYGGAAATDDAARTALEDEAERLGAKLGVDCLQLRNREARHPDWPRQELYVTFRKTIAPDPEENLAAIPRKQRAMVRKGVKAGLRGEIDGDAGRFFSLYAENVHRQGTPALPKRYFERLLTAFGTKCEALIIAGPDGTLLSGVLSFYFRDEVLPYYAGDALAARECAANDFKYWELMRLAAARGCTVFDYGRSKRDSGSFDFKRHWGFEPEPLHYEYRLFRGDHVPEHHPNNPKYRLAIEAWRRMPLPFANMLGPLLARNLG